MSKMTIRDIDIKGKQMIMRVDFNVPLDKELHITDDRRIREAVPTIKFALDNGARRVVLMSHMGRPDGQVVDILRLNPVAKRLSCTGLCSSLQRGSINRVLSFYCWYHCTHRCICFPEKRRC